MADWLRAGAVAAGMGAALAMGAGEASADTDSGERSAARSSSSDARSAGDRSGTATRRGPAVRETTSAATTRTARVVEDDSADKLADEIAEKAEPVVDDGQWDGGIGVIGANPGVLPGPVTAPDDPSEKDPDGEWVVIVPPENPGGGTPIEVPIDEEKPSPVEPPEVVIPDPGSEEPPVVEVPVDEPPVIKDPDEPVIPDPGSEEPPVVEVPVDEPPATGSPQYPDAITAPVTWRSMASDVLRWVGLPTLTESSWIPALAVPWPLNQLWIGLRRIEYHLFNDRPTAKPGQLSQDTVTGVVLGSMNGTDGDGDKISYTLVGLPANGHVEILADGTYRYTPTAAFARSGGLDSFTVRVTDTVGNPWHVNGLAGWFGLSRPRTVTVTVTLQPITNVAPSVPALVEAPAPDNSGVVAGTLLGMDPNGDALDYAMGVAPLRGHVSVSADGRYVYVPDPQARHAAAAEDAAADLKTDHFTVRVSDGFGGTVETTVAVLIEPLNTVPAVDPVVVLHDDSQIVVAYDGDWTTYSTLSILKITPNAADADGDGVYVTLTNADPAKGSVKSLGDGSFLYIPSVATLESGSTTDAVTITVRDGHGGVHTHEETVTISPQRQWVSDPIVIGGLIGVGGTVLDSSGQNISLGEGLVIGGGSYHLGLTESGQELVVSGPGTTSFVPVVTEEGPAAWSVVETESSTSIYVRGRLATMFYLGG
ncbi:Ig-like domain-containing protein [Mycolicibacterium vaccae]|uniref:Ig-like domain-containing protein n=1 Tax=Mycolicibacterium vaccae TaxID=1810 RepID=UPI003CF1FEDB